jgi:hypothetical protein
LTGVTGIQGLTGITGLQGHTGIQGLTGVTGIQGIQGLTGVTGIQGLTGVTGLQGLTGVTGLQGIQGLTGITGIQGLTGVTGVKGATGAKPGGQLFLSAAGMWPSGATGCTINTAITLPTYFATLYYLSFDPTTQQFACCTVAMPSDWDASTVTAKFYWIHPATTTNFGVTWQLQGISYGDGENLDVAQGTLQLVADTGGNTSYLYITDATPAITISGAGASELVQFRLARVPADNGDTMAVNAYLLGCMITYGRS